MRYPPNAGNMLTVGCAPPTPVVSMAGCPSPARPFRTTSNPNALSPSTRRRQLIPESGTYHPATSWPAPAAATARSAGSNHAHAFFPGGRSQWSSTMGARMGIGLLTAASHRSRASPGRRVMN